MKPVRLDRLRELGPGGVAAKLMLRASRATRGAVARRRDQAASSFVPAVPGERLRPRLGPLPLARLVQAADLDGIACDAMAQRFDLLGSGPAVPHHGLACTGVAGHRYPPGPAVAADAEGRWLEAQVTPANLPRAQALWRLVSPEYRPIDWQLDFKSGYRWSARTWSGDIAACPPGADVKVPWELARLQHLAVLPLAHARAPHPRWAAAFRDQVLDFLAANPPRFGINWRCAMDVAIRAANLALAWDLFAGQGVGFDTAFETELAAALRAHGRFVFANLEWQPDYRGNHYLADLVGLLFCAAYLPAGRETRRWRDFAGRALIAETTQQFLADGACHEASTCYHRLSAELVCFGTALLLGEGEDVPPQHGDRLAAMAAFVRDATAPDDRLVQIGDNDNGRLFKLLPPRHPDGREDVRRAGDLAHAVSGLLAQPPHDLFGKVTSALAGGRRLGGSACPAAPPRSTIAVPATGVRMRRYASAQGGEPPTTAWYPDFGVAIFRASWLYLLVRCRGRPVAGPAAHAHNDQLAVELWLDGKPLIRDPGSYLYTAAPDWRDRYRSIRAHDAPWLETLGEPAGLAEVFALPGGPLAECLHCAPDGFLGRLRPPAPAIHRAVRIGSRSVEIMDWLTGETAPRWLLPDPAATFSDAYGWRELPSVCMTGSRS